MTAPEPREPLPATDTPATDTRDHEVPATDTPTTATHNSEVPVPPSVEPTVGPARAKDQPLDLREHGGHPILLTASSPWTRRAWAAGLLLLFVGLTVRRLSAPVGFVLEILGVVLVVATILRSMTFGKRK